MSSTDWSALRVISCDDVLAKLREVLPDATVQAQRNAIERGWDFTVQMPQDDARWFHAALSDFQMEDVGEVGKVVAGLLGQVHDAAVLP